MNRFLLSLIVFFCAQCWLQGASIPILNPSFETATLPFNQGNGPFNNILPGSDFTTGGTLADWTASSTTGNADVGAFAPTLGGLNWSTKWWDGNNIVLLQEINGGTTSLSQTLSAVLDDDTTYTLSALVGLRGGAGFEPAFNYSIELFAGSDLLASASNLALTNDGFGTDSAVYTSGNSDPNADEPLEVVLTSTGSVDGFTEAAFDEISLDASPSNTPEPRSSVLFILGFVAASSVILRRRLRLFSAR